MCFTFYRIIQLFVIKIMVIQTMVYYVSFGLNLSFNLKLKLFTNQISLGFATH